MCSQYVTSGQRTLEHLRRYREIAQRVKTIAQAACAGARVYAFGSVVTGRFTAASDIDLLIVCDELQKERSAELKAHIRRAVGLDVPLQLHTATVHEFQHWYMRFIDECVEV